jgi:hypothetical protein
LLGLLCLFLKGRGIDAGHRPLGGKIDPRNREAAWHGTEMNLRAFLILFESRGIPESVSV